MTTTTPGTTDYLSLAKEAFSSSTSFFDASIRRQAENAIRQFQGVHPAGSKYHAEAYKSRSRLFRPKTRTTIRKNEAVAAEAFFSTNDVVAITPENDNNKRQQASAAIHQALLNYRLKKSIPWFMIAIGAYQDAQTVGVCISYQCWLYDPAKKIDKPAIKLLPLENCRIDPGADWTDPVNSSPYFIEMIPMYVKDVKHRMTAPDAKTGAPKWKKMEDAQLLTAINKYGDTTRQTRERGRTDSKEQSSAITAFSVVWIHKNIMEIDGKDMLWYTLGDTALLSDPVPLDQVYFHGRRPYVMGNCIIETHKIYPDGVPGITKDIQGEINEVTNLRIDNVKFALNKRYFVKRNKQVDLRSLTRNVPGSATMMDDPEKDVVIQSTPDVTSSSFQEQDRLNLDFDDVSGSFSQGSVSSNRKLNETVGGMKLLDSTSNLVSGYQLRTFVETWMEPVLRQLLLLEQHYETDDVILALAGEQAELMDKFGIDKMTDELLMQEVTLNVNVGIGATNTQDQVNNFMKAMGSLREILADGLLEKYGLDINEVIKELFGKLGYKDGGRFFNSDEEDPSLTAAKATITELQQQLGQKTAPELVAKQVEKLDAEIRSLATKDKDVSASAMEKTMRTFFSSGQTAQMLAAVPQLAPLMDALAQACGYQPPTPGGVDPNLPQLGAPAPGLTQEVVANKKTGIEFLPGDGSVVAGDTSPNTPAGPVAPDSPMVGNNAGIETLESDS